MPSPSASGPGSSAFVAGDAFVVAEGGNGLHERRGIRQLLLRALLDVGGSVLAGDEYQSLVGQEPVGFDEADLALAESAATPSRRGTALRS